MININCKNWDSIISSIYSAIFLVKSSKFPIIADDVFDDSGCVTITAAINSTILSSKSLILKLKFFKFFKMFKLTTSLILFGIDEIRFASLLIQLFIDADL